MKDKSKDSRNFNFQFKQKINKSNLNVPERAVSELFIRIGATYDNTEESFRRVSIINEVKDYFDNLNSNKNNKKPFQNFI